MKPLLDIQNLQYTFHSDRKDYPAVKGISFTIKQGECLGLLGESGCGKTTTARLIAGLLHPDNGRIIMDGEDITEKKPQSRRIQMVFQNPVSSFDPRYTLRKSIQEGIQKPSKEKTDEILNAVSLSSELADRYPGEVSGGQCQRAAIARALLHEPRLLILDEAVSDLDVITQSEILSMIHTLQKETRLSILFICHDPAIVQDLCHRICVMKDGTVIESGNTEAVFSHPSQPYTAQLLDAAF